MFTKELQQKILSGDGLSDKELSYAINHYSVLVEHLKPLRKQYELAFIAGIHTLQQLESFKEARDAHAERKKGKLN